jgi:capsular exopolysaccharide synthesis family protein
LDKNLTEPEILFKDEEEIHLRDYFRVIVKRQRLIAAFLLVTITVVAIVTFSTTPLYQGNCKVLIEKSRTVSLADRYYQSMWDPEFLSTQIEIIKSRRVALRVVDMLDLENTWDRYMGIDRKKTTIFHAIKESISGALKDMLEILPSDSNNTSSEAATSPELSKREMLAIAIAREISVTPLPETRLAIISYTSPNPRLAAMVANSVAKAYIETILNMKMDATRRTLEWMTKKAAEEGNKVKEAEERLHRYMKKNDIVTLENRLTVLPQKLSALSSQIVKAQAEFEEYKALYQMVRKVGNNLNAAETIPAIADNKALQTLNEQIVLSEKNIMTLSGKYGAKHPVMKKAVSDLQLLKNKRRDEISRGIRSIKNNFELARGRLENLQEQMEKTRAEALRLNERFIQYSALKREVDTTRKLYDALMVKIEEKSITEETQPVNLEVVETAEVPIFPVKPRKLRNMLLGLVLGLFGGIGLAFFIEYLDDTVNYPEEAERILKTACMGTIPFSEARKNNEFNLATYDAPRSPLAESFRALRTSILLSTPDKTPGSILVTSAQAGEGKTTIASNLAFIMAQMDKKVLLIDADLRKPRVHKVFRLDNSAGLSNFLAGAVDRPIVSQGYDVNNLHVITSGPVPPNPSELLSSRRLQSLLESASSEYQMIIIDSAPVLAVADSIILSRMVESIVMVTRAHKTRYDAVKRAIRSIADVNGKLAGIVINALNIQKSDYYYNYYYSRYGHYGEDETEEKGETDV